MVKTPKISVIVPVYKMEPYLRNCLDSIMNQTYQNLEIILVDDGSPDNCGAICDECAARDARLVVLHTANCGAYEARNSALDIAGGDYIGFVDADDWLDPHMYESLLSLALEYNADIAQCEMINEGSYAQTRSKRMGCVRCYHREEIPGALFREEITHGLLNKLFRAEIWSGRRFPEGYYHADAMTMARADLFCATFVRMDAALYHYNTTNPSITRGKKKLLHIQSMEKLFETYSSAAENALEEGSFFICREIPSAGRLLPPSGAIAVETALRHIRFMHGIFERHWNTARTTQAYCQSPGAKRLLWHMYHRCPTAASILVYWFARLFRRQ